MGRSLSAPQNSSSTAPWGSSGVLIIGAFYCKNCRGQHGHSDWSVATLHHTQMHRVFSSVKHSRITLFSSWATVALHWDGTRWAAPRSPDKPLASKTLLPVHWLFFLGPLLLSIDHCIPGKPPQAVLETLLVKLLWKHSFASYQLLHTGRSWTTSSLINLSFYFVKKKNQTDNVDMTQNT